MEPGRGYSAEEMNAMQTELQRQKNKHPRLEEECRLRKQILHLKKPGHVLVLSCQTHSCRCCGQQRLCDASSCELSGTEKYAGMIHESKHFSAKCHEPYIHFDGLWLPSTVRMFRRDLKQSWESNLSVSTGHAPYWKRYSATTQAFGRGAIFQLDVERTLELYKPSFRDQIDNAIQQCLPSVLIQMIVAYLNGECTECFTALFK